MVNAPTQVSDNMALRFSLPSCARLRGGFRVVPGAPSRCAVPRRYTSGSAASAEAQMSAEQEMSLLRFADRIRVFIYKAKLMTKATLVAATAVGGMYFAATTYDHYSSRLSDGKKTTPFAAFNTGVAVIDKHVGALRWDLYALPAAISSIHVGVFALTKGRYGGALRRNLVHWPNQPTIRSLLLNQFFHMDAKHLLVTVGTIMAVGPFLQQILGPAHFVACVLSGGIAGTLVAHNWRVFTLSRLSTYGGGSTAFALLGTGAGLYPHWRPAAIADWKGNLDAKDMIVCTAVMWGLLFIGGGIGLDFIAHLGAMGYGWWRGSIKLNDVIDKLVADDAAAAVSLAKAQSVDTSKEVAKTPVMDVDPIFDDDADDIMNTSSKQKRESRLLTPSQRQSEMDATVVRVIGKIEAALGSAG